MKTFMRLIRRYVLLAVGLSLLLIVLALAFIVWLGVEIADHLQQNAAGEFFFDERDTVYWMDGYEWAMVLDDDGKVVWQYQLPRELHRQYTASEIAVFSRWYLDDYPVFCQVRDYGLLVLGLPKDSVWKYNFWTYPDLIEWIFYRGSTLILGVLLLILMWCLLFSWRGAKSLRVVADGLDALAEGRTIQLTAKGFAGELGEKLRTQWIAGVSHDIRTPLSLILGWAEQLQRDISLPENARHKAAGIQAQSEKIRALVEDLNLTSKLQYGAQPLRCEPVHAGPLLRRLVADFCSGPLAAQCQVELEVVSSAETAELHADTALMARVFENILGNSVRHNSGPVCCMVTAEVQEKQLLVTFTDNGAGFPPAVLAVLHGETPEDTAPHILGLHVVEQILHAHGGSAEFSQNKPRGSKVVLCLPIAS